MRQIFVEIGWEKKLLIFFAVTLGMILLGPFGTYDDLDFWMRSVFWMIVVCGVAFFMHIAVTVCMATSVLGTLGQIPRIMVGSVIGAFPAATVVIFVNAVLRPPILNADVLPLIWLQIALIGFVVCPIEYVDWRKFFSGDEDVQPVRTKLHKRLRTGPESVIISMSMQDHYVQVTTDLGPELVLMRFADAIKEVEGIAGIQTHRSHWVAETQLQAIEKRGHRTFAKLTDGRELPVSDTYAKAVAERLAAVTASH